MTPARADGRWRAATLVPVDERSLAEHLITYDTSNDEGLRVAAGFVKGWLESNAIDVFETTFGGLPVLTAEVGAASGPTVIFHGISTSFRDIRSSSLRASTATG